MKTKGLFMLPEIRDSLVANGRISILRPIPPVIDINANKKYSRIGREGDELYVIEAGKRHRLDSGVLWVFSDGTAKLLDLDEVVHPTEYDYHSIESDPEIASNMPSWAARVFVRIDSVSYPIRLKDLRTSDFEKMGIRNEGDNNYSLGGFTYGASSWVNAFAAHFDHVYSEWKTYKGDYYRFVYDEHSAAGIPHWLIKKLDQGMKATTYANPHVTMFDISITEIK